MRKIHLISIIIEILWCFWNIPSSFKMPVYLILNGDHGSCVLCPPLVHSNCKALPSISFAVFPQVAELTNTLGEL